MATAADVRAWAVSNGHPELEGQRGRLGQDILDEYELAHGPADDYGPGTSPGDFGPDPGYVTADDPPTEDLTEALSGLGAGGAGGAGGGPQEERPGRPGKARGRARWTWRAPGTQGKPRPTRARRSFKRVSVAPMIEDTYRDLASAFGGIPPLQRCLRAQAPLAGVILDPKVKDTAIDRVALQPMARNYELVKAGSGLLGTPMAVLAVLATAPQPTGNLIPVIGPDGPVMGPDGTPALMPEFAPATIQHQLAMVSLRMCARAMADTAGDSMSRIAERAEESAERDRAVDEFIAYVLGIPLPPSPEERESEQDRQAGLRLAGVTG